MNSEIAGLCERIKQCASMVGSGDALARLSGIPRRTLENYLSGRSEPKASALFAIAKSAGVSIDWLIAGEGFASPRKSIAADQQALIAPPCPIQVLDEDLLGRVVEGVRQTYKDLGAGISDRDVGRLSARIYSDLSEAYDDPDERGIGLKMALQQLRRDLSKPPSGQADKRLA